MLPNIGMSELLVILVLVMIIFGAGKLPEIGAGLGKAIGISKKQPPVNWTKTKSQRKRNCLRITLQNNSQWRIAFS